MTLRGCWPLGYEEGAGDAYDFGALGGGVRGNAVLA